MLFFVLFCNHLEEEEKAGCFAIIIVPQIHCYYKCSVALPHGAVGWSAVVIVVFPDHTHLLFRASAMNELSFDNFCFTMCKTTFKSV